MFPKNYYSRSFATMNFKALRLSAFLRLFSFIFFNGTIKVQIEIQNFKFPINLIAQQRKDFANFSSRDHDGDFTAALMFPNSIFHSAGKVFECDTISARLLIDGFLYSRYLTKVLLGYCG